MDLCHIVYSGDCLPGLAVQQQQSRILHRHRCALGGRGLLAFLRPLGVVEKVAHFLRRCGRWEFPSCVMVVRDQPHRATRNPEAFTRQYRILEAYRSQLKRVWLATEQPQRASGYAGSYPFVLGEPIRASDLRATHLLQEEDEPYGLSAPRLMTKFIPVYIAALATLLIACEWAGTVPGRLARVYAPMVPKPISRRRGVQIAWTLFGSGSDCASRSSWAGPSEPWATSAGQHRHWARRYHLALA